METTGDLGTGVFMMCLCCLVPFGFGALTGWAMRGRSEKVGLPWAFLPGFVKRIWEMITTDD